MDYTRSMEPFVLQEVTPTGEEIGRGAYGTVCKVKHCGINYAAKQMHPILLEACDPSSVSQYMHHYLRRAYFQSTCPHPNIVRFIGMYHTRPSMSNKGVPALVMELMDCSLRTFVEQDGTMPLHSALSILHDVSLGLWYLRSRNPPVTHCDLTPNHVLVNTSLLVAKIASLGEVVPEDFNNEMKPGTLFFMAP